MWASVRSTWLAVGSGCASLLPGSRNNAAGLPAPLALLWSSDLVVPFSCRSLTSIQSHLTLEGRLWSLACQSISLGNKANCLLGSAGFFEFLHSSLLASRFICSGYLVGLLTPSGVCGGGLTVSTPLCCFRFSWMHLHFSKLTVVPGTQDCFMRFIYTGLVNPSTQLLELCSFYYYWALLSGLSKTVM